jgi:hypothetical protein
MNMTRKEKMENIMCLPDEELIDAVAQTTTDLYYLEMLRRFDMLRHKERDRMKVYIIGPYRAKTESEVRCNIENARKLAEEVWICGHVALCPHLNTQHMGGLVPDADFLSGDLLLLESCDAALVVDGYHASQGSLAEINHAKGRGMPIYWSLGTLLNAVKP